MENPNLQTLAELAERRYLESKESEMRYVGYLLFNGLKPDVLPSDMTTFSADVLVSAMTAIGAQGGQINAATVLDNLVETGRKEYVGGVFKLSEINSYGRDLGEGEAKILRDYLHDKGFIIEIRDGKKYAVIQLSEENHG
jgi:hypothetical protein